MNEDRIKRHEETIEDLLLDIEWMNKTQYKSDKTSTAGFIEENRRLIRQHERLIEMLKEPSR